MKKREILFRGKRVKDRRWFYGDLVFWHDYSTPDRLNHPYIRTSLIHEYEVIPETVGQFTGFMDKVKCRYFDGCMGEYFNCKFIVVWDNGWYAEFIETKKKRNLADICDDSIHISNIHDNPELLK